MINGVVRAFASWRCALLSTAALAVLACVTGMLTLSAAAASACPNEQLRGESNVNPITSQPYSAGLPDCRAYEVVSPPFKQSSSAQSISGGTAVATDGEAVGYQAEGDFGEPENYEAGSFSPALKYASRRGASGWITTSTFAPASLISLPTIFAGLNGDFSPDLRSFQVSCGITALGKVAPIAFTGAACARRAGGGPWASSGVYSTFNNLPETNSSGMYLGASSNGSRVFIQPTQRLLESDVVTCCSRGIYEISGVGSESGPLGVAPLRLVNVDNAGNELAIHKGGQFLGPLIGDEREVEPHAGGTAYQAISQSGETVFFTATPEGSETPGGLTVFARRACGGGPSCVQGRETIAVSNPSLNVSDPALNVSKSPTSQWECKNCKGGGPVSATFQGASADGSKVFFTTSQKLLTEDATLNLYEYDFERPAGEKLVLLSHSTEPKGAVVKGVLRTSSDGSIVYFVAGGVLEGAAPDKTINNPEEKPQAGNSNLYAYDTHNEKLKFVANIQVKGESFYIKGGKEGPESFDEVSRHAQTTPDGRYLVFSSGGKLAGDTNSEAAQAVYRYDFERGELTWVSHAAPGCGSGCGAQGENAWVAALPGTLLGAEADIGDWNRAISGCPNGVNESEQHQCPPGQYDGEYIIFTTRERLQNNDENKAVDVYEWHCPSSCANPATEGVVSLISDGQNPKGAGEAGTGENPVAGMSPSASDVFFFSATALVGQDVDGLGDVYDARMGGGFKKPQKPLECEGETCQGPSKEPPSFGAAASSMFAAGGNLSPAAPGSGIKPAIESKLSTEAQQLAKALAACKRKPKGKRAACESQAKKRYQLAKALKACKGKPKGKRASCESQARKRYR